MGVGAAHGKAVDWWAMGTLLYEMLHGLPPFYSQNVAEMYEKIQNERLVFPKHFQPRQKYLPSRIYRIHWYQSFKNVISADFQSGKIIRF